MNLDNITYFSSDEECYELLSAWKIAAKKNIESKSSTMYHLKKNYMNVVLLAIQSI